MTTYRKGTKCPFCLRWIKYEQVKGSEYYEKAHQYPHCFRQLTNRKAREHHVSRDDTAQGRLKA